MTKKSTNDMGWEQWSQNQQNWRAIDFVHDCRGYVYIETSTTDCGYRRVEGCYRKFKPRTW